MILISLICIVLLAVIGSHLMYLLWRNVDIQKPIALLGAALSSLVFTFMVYSSLKTITMWVTQL